MSDQTQSPPPPTEADMALDLAAHLRVLDRIMGPVLVCGVYRVEDHRAAIRRALHAEAEVARIRESLGKDGEQ